MWSCNSDDYLPLTWKFQIYLLALNCTNCYLCHCLHFPKSAYCAWQVGSTAAALHPMAQWKESGVTRTAPPHTMRSQQYQRRTATHQGYPQGMPNMAEMPPCHQAGLRSSYPITSTQQHGGSLCRRPHKMTIIDRRAIIKYSWAIIC